MPFDALQIHLLVAETFAVIGEHHSAAVHAEAARQHLELVGDAGLHAARLAALSAELRAETGATSISLEVPALSARERDILRLLPTRMSLREVGDQLHVSRDTVKTYVTRIYPKLGVFSGSAAVTRHGSRTPGPPLRHPASRRALPVLDASARILTVVAGSGAAVVLRRRGIARTRLRCRRGRGRRGRVRRPRLERWP